jgi:PHD/YefM family antitoxin component YafN of YafNO toxin-antitoxin module
LENQQVIADQELELRNLREALLKYRKNQAAQEAGLESINKFKDEAEVRGGLTC